MSQFTQACLRNATFDLLCSHMREGVKQCYDQSVCLFRLISLSVILPLPEHVPYIRARIYTYSSPPGISPILLCNSAHFRQKWSITVPCSVLYGMSQASIDKLQRVQNILARVAVGAPWTSSSLNIRRDLHWLHVGHRITYKLCLTTWKTLHTSQPLYLSELISHYLSPRSLRSSNTNLLTTLPDQPVLLATFPLGPFLCLYLLLETLHLHTFVLSIP